MGQNSVSNGNKICICIPLTTRNSKYDNFPQEGLTSFCSELNNSCLTDRRIVGIKNVYLPSLFAFAYSLHYVA